MKYFVVEPFTLETSQEKVTLPAGKILELSQEQAARLAGKVEPLPIPANGGRDLQHYCEPGECWCSEKLTGSCIKPDCEYYKQ